MLYLDLHFSCTQRLMTPAYRQKGSLEDRVCATFFSVSLLVDASIHLFAATYKGFGWAASQISRKNPPDYYKEAYSHLIKALRYFSMAPFGSLAGFIYPSVFQSKKLQEYLGWKLPLRSTSETMEKTTLREELQSKNAEIERLKSQIDSLAKSLVPNVLQDDLPSLEDSLVRMANSGSLCAEDIMSVSSDSDVEFVDALEDVSGLNKTLEKELQLKSKEIEKLKLQIDFLNKILSPIGNLCPYNQILVIQKTLNKSIGDTPTVYEYLSDPVKKEITNAFQDKCKMNFLQFCDQKKPDIDSTSQIFTELLSKHNFRSWSNPKETSISAVINTLFGFV
ncbi:MAG: hypothetical protein C5B45_02290 [Chlamydiae bacterium]|nr:MAG: hypothetical protein C5B45_02290 [Chlamydiota bacterium]